MADVARRRADQLGDLMVRLVLRTVDLEKVFGAAVKNLSERFDGAGLSRAGRAEQEKDAGGPVRRTQAGLIHLDVRDDVLQRTRLTDDLPRQQFDEIAERYSWTLRSPGIHDAFSRFEPDYSVARGTSRSSSTIKILDLCRSR
jgi:hypothetical protein